MNTVADKVKEYTEPRHPEDRDLVAEVRNLLVASGLAMEAQKAYDTHNYIVEACIRRPLTQRFLLNRFWNLQLIMAPKPSIEERSCLIVDGSIDEWLHLFKAKILPFLIETRLPAVAKF
jgi:hypothetical protein